MDNDYNFGGINFGEAMSLLDRLVEQTKSAARKAEEEKKAAEAARMAEEDEDDELRAQIEETAQLAMMVYRSYMNAGFSSTQAFDLLTGMLRCASFGGRR